MGRAPEITHKIMSSIKSSNTVPELLLRRAVWRMGMRYRINDRQVCGKPDITFSRVKLAVFCDGDYWHGHNWALRGYANLEDELAHYKPFWADKIRRNVRRDREVDEKLSCEGWSILRFWESDILRDPQECAQEVFKKYRELYIAKGTAMNNNESNSEIIDYPQLIGSIIVQEGLTEEKQAEMYEPLSRYLSEKTPSALYRFRSCNERNFSAFDKGELWFSRAETMNDDFDSLIYYDREVIAGEIDQAFEQLSSNMKSTLSNVPIELQQMLQSIPASVDGSDLQGFHKPFLDYVDQALESLSSLIRREMKFACFSDDVESPLMWGHYADSSRGFALAYDFRNSRYTGCDGCANKNICRNKRMCALYPMVYTNERLNATKYIKWLLQKKLALEIPDVGIRTFMESSLRCPDQFMLTKILIHKAEAWKPEREWRLVCSCNAPQYSNEQYSYAIQAPTALYLGSQISPVNEKLLCYLAKGKGIPVYKMSVSPNSLQYRLTANLVTNM